MLHERPAEGLIRVHVPGGGAIIDDNSNHSVQIQHWLDRLKEGDPAARDQLLNTACDRLTRLTRKMLGRSPDVHRWEETGDVFQNAAVRLCRALDSQRPATVREFFGLAALQIRRELVDLARHYKGPEGLGENHASQALGNQSTGGSPGGGYQPADSTCDPQKLAEWAEMHECAANLPAEEKEVFELLWYHGLSQEDAATVMNVSARTVKRYWQSARLLLHEKLGADRSAM